MKFKAKINSIKNEARMGKTDKPYNVTIITYDAVRKDTAPVEYMKVSPVFTTEGKRILRWITDGGLKIGSTYLITLEKNDKGYNEWMDLELIDAVLISEDNNEDEEDIF